MRIKYWHKSYLLRSRQIQNNMRKAVDENHMVNLYSE